MNLGSKIGWLQKQEFWAVAAIWNIDRSGAFYLYSEEIHMISAVEIKTHVIMVKIGIYS